MLTLGLGLGCTSPLVPIDEGSESGSSTSADVTVTATGPTMTMTTTSGTAGPPDTTGDTTSDPTADTTAGPVTETGDPSSSSESSSDSGSTTDGVTASGSGSTSDASTGSTGDMGLPDFSGEFLFAMATPIDPSLPFQWIATFDFLPVGMGGVVDVELQALALDTGSSTSPRTFFGPPLVFPAIPVAADGSFTVGIGPMPVPAETNPIIFIDAQADMVSFSAQVLDADGLCGTANGNIVMPIFQSLAGSTFGAVRVPGTLPASLPVVFPSSC